MKVYIISDMYQDKYTADNQIREVYDDKKYAYSRFRDLYKHKLLEYGETIKKADFYDSEAYFVLKNGDEFNMYLEDKEVFTDTLPIEDTKENRDWLNADFLGDRDREENL